MESGGSALDEAGRWAWDNRDWVLEKLKQLWTWFRSKQRDPSSILVIGPGGVGKSTLARLLSGEFQSMFDIPGEYEESLITEEHALEDDPSVELVVPPGQRHRRATWSDIEAGIAGGEFSGVILVGAYGYHSLGEISYKRHRLYEGKKGEFVQAYLSACRQDELSVIGRLAPFIQANTSMCWLLSVVTKEDLWFSREAEMKRLYHEGEYDSRMEAISTARGASFRHEEVTCSLVIRNFQTGEKELLAKTVAGYDQGRQQQSIRRLFEALDALRKWEEQ